MTTTISFTTPTKVGSFNFYNTVASSPVVHEIYNIDVNSDGVDEVIFAGFMTSPKTTTTYRDTTLHLFQFIDGKWQKNTDTWFPDGINLVGATNQLVYGDFNGDGKRDIFAAADADIDLAVPVVWYENRGGPV